MDAPLATTGALLGLALSWRFCSSTPPQEWLPLSVSRVGALSALLTPVLL